MHSQRCLSLVLGWPHPTLAAMLTAPLAPRQAQSTLRAAGRAAAGPLLPLSPQNLAISVRGLRQQHPLLPALLHTPCCCLSLGAIPACPPATWGHVGGWWHVSVASTQWVGSQGGDGTVLLPGRRSWEGAPAFGCSSSEGDRQPLVPTALSQQAGASVAPLRGPSAASRLLGGGIDPRVGEVLEEGHVDIGLRGNPSQKPLVPGSPSTSRPGCHTRGCCALGGGDGASHTQKAMLGLPPHMVGGVTQVLLLDVPSLTPRDATAFRQALHREDIPPTELLPLTFLASSMRMSCMEIWAKGGRS